MEAGSNVGISNANREHACRLRPSPDAANQPFAATISLSDMNHCS